MSGRGAAVVSGGRFFLFFDDDKSMQADIGLASILLLYTSQAGAVN
jgi:hypothetical protein